MPNLNPIRHIKNPMYEIAVNSRFADRIPQGALPMQKRIATFEMSSGFIFNPQVEKGGYHHGHASGDKHEDSLSFKKVIQKEPEY